jgi:cephalosporin hydroxylase
VICEEWPYFGQPQTETSGILRRMHARILTDTTYCGIQTLKNPTDAWIYDEIIWRQRPDVIVEIGNWHGGQLLRMAHFCDTLGHGEIVGVDIEPVTTKAVVDHPRIQILTGEATEMFEDVEAFVGGRSAMVIDDSDHGYTNTLSVLNKYSTLVHPGGYMVVEDTIGIEAQRAVEIFLGENKRHWEADVEMEEFGVSWNPNGYLRRK